MERGEAWFIAVTCAVLGLILGTAWSDLGHQMRWLYDYQTLLTGILAVAAAFVTVNAMNRTEERQQQRHNELMRLNLRSDRLRARRAAIPYAEWIDRDAKELEKLIGEIRSIEPQTEQFHLTMRRLVFARLKVFSHLESENVKNAKDLFGSSMSLSYQDALKRGPAEQAHEGYIQGFVYSAYVLPNAFVIESCSEYIEATSLELSPMKDFAMRLKQLAGYYDDPTIVPVEQQADYRQPVS